MRPYEVENILFQCKRIIFFFSEISMFANLISTIESINEVVIEIKLNLISKFDKEFWNLNSYYGHIFSLESTKKQNKSNLPLCKHNKVSHIKCVLIKVFQSNVIHLIYEPNESRSKATTYRGIVDHRRANRYAYVSLVVHLDLEKIGREADIRDNLGGVCKTQIYL